MAGGGFGDVVQPNAPDLALGALADAFQFGELRRNLGPARRMLGGGQRPGQRHELPRPATVAGG